MSIAGSSGAPIRKHRDMREEHAAIFESAIAGDIERCAALVGRHIDASVRDIAGHLHDLDAGARSAAAPAPRRTASEAARPGPGPSKRNHRDGRDKGPDKPTYRPLHRA